MSLISVNGTALPIPQKYSIPMQDMDSSDSSYSESGIYIRNRIRQGVCRLELAWLVCGSEAADLLTAIQPDKVQENYYDPRTGAAADAEMFVEDRSCELVSYKSDEDPDANHWAISFNLVQY
jgi:hypothetical protein